MKAAARKIKWELITFTAIFAGLRYNVRLTPTAPFTMSNGHISGPAFNVEVSQVSTGRVEKFTSYAQPNRTTAIRWIISSHDELRKEDGQ